MPVRPKGRHYRQHPHVPQERRLPTRPYAIQAYLRPDTVGEEESAQTSLIDEAPAGGKRAPVQVFSSLLLPSNGKFFKRFSVSDTRRLQQAESLWERNKETLPYPKSVVPLGEKTKSGLLAHHYNYWHQMFAPRQLLALSTLLQGIMAESDQVLREFLLCAFSNTLEGNNLFVRNIPSRQTPGGTAPAGVFARHDFQPKATCCEQNVWGTVSGNNTFVSRMKMLEDGIRFRNSWCDGQEIIDPVRSSSTADLKSVAAHEGIASSVLAVAHVITDPPYVGNVNYAELADFFYVWLRLSLKDIYPQFGPEYTPKTEEIIENSVRGKSIKDFYEGLARALLA